MAAVKRALAGLAAAALVVLLSPVRAGAASIEPGDFMTSDGAGCTLGFVVTSASDTFFLTAAHCVKVPPQVKLEDGTLLGDAVAEGSSEDVPRDVSQDWALIRVRPEIVGQVV